MTIDAMTLMDVYEEMRARKMCRTKDEFSSDWLSMNWSYFATMGERTTADGLLLLWRRLQEVGEHDLARQVFRLINRRIDERTRKRPAVKIAHRRPEMAAAVRCSA